MKDYTRRNATYRGIPCWYNPCNEELTAKTKFYKWLLNIVVWIDINIIDIDEFPIWVEVDELEK